MKDLSTQAVALERGQQHCWANKKTEKQDRKTDRQTIEDSKVLKVYSHHSMCQNLCIHFGDFFSKAIFNIDRHQDERKKLKALKHPERGCGLLKDKLEEGN